MPPSNSGTGPIGGNVAELPELHSASVSPSTSLDNEEAVLKQIPLDDDGAEPKTMSDHRQLFSWRRYAGVGLLTVGVIVAVMLFFDTW